MASLKEAGELITEQLRERVDRLASAIEDDAPDFAQITRLANAVGELADLIGDTYSDFEQTLMRRLRGDAGSNNDRHDSRQAEEESRGEEQHPQTGENGPTAEDVTKEELLERARGSNIHSRSTMSKDELARAVEARHRGTLIDDEGRAPQGSERSRRLTLPART